MQKDVVFDLQRMNFLMRAESLYQYEIMVKMVKMAFSLTPFQILIKSIFCPFVIVPKTLKRILMLHL